MTTPHPEFGDLLRVVKAGGTNQCPTCDRPAELAVYEEAAVWRCCGFAVPLPPLPSKPRFRPIKRAA